MNPPEPLARPALALGLLCMMAFGLVLVAAVIAAVIWAVRSLPADWRDRVRRFDRAGWKLLTGLALFVAGFLLYVRAAEPMLRRNTSLENPKLDAIVFYWGFLFGLLAVAVWATERGWPGWRERLHARLSAMPAGPGRAVLAGVAMFVSVVFASWAMFGHMVFPVGFAMAAMTAGSAAAMAGRPFQPMTFAAPWSPDLAPDERRRNANVGMALVVVGAIVTIVSASVVWPDAPPVLLTVMAAVVGFSVWAHRRLSRWGYPEWWANRDRLLYPDAVPAPASAPAPVAPPVAVAPAAPKVCPKCTAAVAADAPLGLCPKCLLNVALASVADPRRTSPFHGPHTPPAPAEVQEFFPHLQVLELIGVGGMGAVYKVRQPGLDRFAALKLIRPREDDPTFAERFAREAKALARLAHPNIVTVYETGEAGGSLFLLMEYVDGVTLREPMKAKSLAPAQALGVVAQVCTALQFAHEQGVVHRDIKPENILLDKAGKVKIADFGLAKVADADAVSLTRTQQAMGTPHYMAPEQWERPQAVDHRADMYALGVVLYELLTGELPLGRFDPPSKRAAVHAGLDAVVLRLLEKDPGRRYQRASDVWTAVERAQAGKPPAGWEWKTKTTLFGWPLVHIKQGAAIGSGDGWARGWLAVGTKAVGLVSFGVLAVGGVAVGPMAVGLLAVGAFAFGGLAVGAVGVGGVMAAGGLAVGPFAAGGGAVGYVVHGGAAIGEHPTPGSRAVPWADVPTHVGHYFEEASNPQFAKHPDNPWRPNVIARWLYPYLGPALIGVVLAAAAVSIGSSKLRTAGRPRAAVHMQGAGVILLFVAGFLAAMFVLPFPLLVLVWVGYGPLLFGLIFWFNRELAAVNRAG